MSGDETGELAWLFEQARQRAYDAASLLMKLRKRSQAMGLESMRSAAAATLERLDECLDVWESLDREVAKFYDANRGEATLTPLVPRVP